MRARVCGEQVISGEGCAASVSPPGVALRVAVEAGPGPGRPPLVGGGPVRSTTAAILLAPSPRFPPHSSELLFAAIDVASELNVQLLYEQLGSGGEAADGGGSAATGGALQSPGLPEGGQSGVVVERAAWARLRVDRLPFEEAHEDWFDLEPVAGMGAIAPRLRLALYKSPGAAAAPLTCALCGKEMAHAFQAPHLALACPQALVPFSPSPRSISSR